jgi:hypothetical protein
MSVLWWSTAINISSSLQNLEKVWLLLTKGYVPQEVSFTVILLREVYLQMNARSRSVYKQVYVKERPFITFAFEFIALFETNFHFLWCCDRSVGRGELRTRWVLRNAVATSPFTTKSSKVLRHMKTAYSFVFGGMGTVVWERSGHFLWGKSNLKRKLRKGSTRYCST